MIKIRTLAIAVLGVFSALAGPSVFAQSASSYPSKIIRIIVPFPPGGATDIMTRNIAQKLSETWKQPVLVENRGGANGMLGADAVAKSQNDGYTYLAATLAHAANVFLFPKAAYQFQRDLEPVAMMGLLPIVPVVRTDSSIRSLNDLVVDSKSKNLNAGSSGNGTAAHLVLELFKGVTGAKIQHVPYKGGSPAMADLLGGQIDVIFALLPEALPHIKAGKLRALAVTSHQRSPHLPDVQTTSEAGLPGLEVTAWNAIMVPSGTPRTIISSINAEVNPGHQRTRDASPLDRARLSTGRVGSGRNREVHSGRRHTLGQGHPRSQYQRRLRLSQVVRPPYRPKNPSHTSFTPVRNMPA